MSSWIEIVLASLNLGDRRRECRAKRMIQQMADRPTGSIPRTFEWTLRPATPTDSYEFNMLDPSDSDPWFYSALLGYADSYTLNSLPSGFSTYTWYVWFVWVYAPDGGVGESLDYHSVYFTNTGSTSPLQQSIPVQKQPFRSWRFQR